MEITGAVALVTGANRGLGLAFAQGLLDAGAAKVYAGVRDPESVTDPNLIPIQLDVTDAEQVRGRGANSSPTSTSSSTTPAWPARRRRCSTDIEDARRQFEVNVLGVAARRAGVRPAARERRAREHALRRLVPAAAEPRHLRRLEGRRVVADQLAQRGADRHAGRRRPRRLHRHRHGGRGPADQKISPQQVVRRRSKRSATTKPRCSPTT